MSQLKVIVSVIICFWVCFFIPKHNIAQNDTNRILKVGADYAYYPYEYINEYHQPDGFDIDIIQAIAEEINCQIEIKSGNWFNIKKDIENGDLDLVAGMYYLPDRAEKVNFSMPYIIITHSIFAKEGDYWQSLKDVKDNEQIKVVVENSSILHRYLTTAGISSNRILPVENQIDALKILTETPNTCALLPELQGMYIAQKHGFDNVYAVGLPILPREYSVAVNIKDTILLNQINDAITEIHKNGTYERIYEKWFGSFINNEKDFINLSLLEVILILGLLFLFVLYIYNFSRWKQSIKTKEAELDKETILREELNNKLLKHETILRKITENTPYPISIMNAEGFFLYVNRNFEDEFGYTRKEIHHLKKWFTLLFEQNLQKENMKQKLEDIFVKLSEGSMQRLSTDSIELSSKDGKKATYIIKVIALDDGQILFFYENITDQLNYENKLTEAKIKAESADKLKSSFLANISHEIRTPMNAILGFSSLLTEDDVEPENKQTYSNLIKKNGNVLMLLIQDIIDFSKIEAGKLNIFPQITSVVELMNDAYYLIKEDYGIKIPDPIQLIYKLPDDSDLNNFFIRVDPNRFAQVLNNLLNNAFKYTDKGVIEFSLTKLPHSKIRISVEDTGIGIKKEHHSLIFNRFSRVESSDVQIRGGTGLGLAIAFQILKLFGSELKLESEEGKGSRFYFDLPFYEGIGDKIDTQAITSYEATRNYSWEGKHILVVEDNSENASYIQALLDKTDCTYSICYSGEETAVELEKLKKLDLVLLDWLLPDIKGDEIANQIKRKFSKTPIIVVTALALIEDKMEILEKNVDDYLAKPIDRNVLMDKINQMIR
jgi:PAS domain S-box-containing protein